jgi:hypothetical protein
MGTVRDAQVEQIRPLHGTPVELVRWPDEAPRRDLLARAGVPRLLVVAADADLPDELSLDEDWVREPVIEADVAARVARLRLATAAFHHDPPYVDDEQVLHRGHLTRRLSATEARLLEALIDHGVVSRDRLREHAWPRGTTIQDGAVDAAVSRLRKRLRGMGMHLRPVRGYGYELVVDASAL